MNKALDRLIESPYLFGSILIGVAFGLFGALAAGFYLLSRFWYMTEGMVFLRFNI